MNRRRFLELLGKATLSTGIVYSFPDVIVPKNIANSVYWNDNVSSSISFSILDKAYRKLCKGSLEPNSIYVSCNRLLEFRNLTEGFMQFHGARIKLDAFADDNSIYIEDPKYRSKTFEVFHRIDVQSSNNFCSSL